MFFFNFLKYLDKIFSCKVLNIYTYIFMLYLFALCNNKSCENFIGHINANIVTCIRYYRENFISN